MSGGENGAGNIANLEPGMELYSVATGRLALLSRRSRQAAKLMGDQDGFTGYNIVPDGRMLWFYATEADAKRARNVAESQGVQCGRNICRFVVAPDGVPEFDSQWARERGMR